MSNTDCIDTPTAPTLARTFAAISDDDTQAFLIGADALIAAVDAESAGQVVADVRILTYYSTPELGVEFRRADPNDNDDCFAVYGNWDRQNGPELAATYNYNGTGYWYARTDAEPLAVVIVDQLLGRPTGPEAPADTEF